MERKGMVLEPGAPGNGLPRGWAWKADPHFWRARHLARCQELRGAAPPPGEPPTIAPAAPAERRLRWRQELELAGGWRGFARPVLP